MQVGPNFIVEKWIAIFGAEDQVDVNFRERLRHGIVFRSPFQGLNFLWHLNPGRCPGLTIAQPVGLRNGAAVW
jgi:hypothetical protein